MGFKAMVLDGLMEAISVNREKKKIQKLDPGMVRRKASEEGGTQMWYLGIKVEKKPNECG